MVLSALTSAYNEFKDGTCFICSNVELGEPIYPRALKPNYTVINFIQYAEMLMTNTTNLDLPYILASQAQKHVTHNEALRALDAIVQLSVADNTLSTPPQTPQEGERYIVAASPTDAWAGKENQIASWQNQAWSFFVPQNGWLSWVENVEVLFVFNDSEWGPATDQFTILGVNATPDDINRISVRSEASLFSHEGAGHQLKVNKQAETDTASILFQTNFSGRAEIATAGDDNLHIKVTDDGTNWKEAMLVDATTGSVSFPNTEIANSGGEASESANQALGGYWRSTRDPNVGWMTNASNAVANVSAISNATFIPLRIGTNGTYSTMSFFCQTGAAGQSVRIALYHASSDNLIGALAVDFEEVACDSAGMKHLSVSETNLSAGIYYAVIQATSNALRFRGGFAPVDSGAGLISSILQPAGIGRIVYLDYSDPWPTDITDHTIGTGVNQIQLLGSFFCPNMMLR